jgi:hypothetical protein
MGQSSSSRNHPLGPRHRAPRSDRRMGKTRFRRRSNLPVDTQRTFIEELSCTKPAKAGTPTMKFPDTRNELVGLLLGPDRPGPLDEVPARGTARGPGLVFSIACVRRRTPHERTDYREAPRGSITEKRRLDEIFAGGNTWELRGSRTSTRARISLIESSSEARHGWTLPI